MTKIKKGFFILAFILTFGIRFHHYDSIMVKAEEIKITIEVEDQKSKIEEPRTIQIMIEEEESRTINIFIEEEEKKQQIQEKKEEVKKEEPKIEQKIEEIIVQNNSINNYGVIINSLTEQDKELICRVVYLEAGNQCLEGQRAVIEVILNRVCGAKWPNTVTEVLSAPRQFSTWKNISTVSPDQVAKMYNVLNVVATANDTILPDTNYVYFNNKSSSKSNIKIQGHWFWK